MITLDQRVKVHCTDTDAIVDGVIVRIRPQGFDVALGELIIHLRNHKPGIYAVSYTHLTLPTNA